MKKNVIIILVAVVLLLLAGMFYFLFATGKIKPQAATTGATLALNPASGTYDIGATFNVDILLNTNANAIDSVDILYLNFDPQALQVQDSDGNSANGIQIKPGSIFSTYTGNIADNTTGKIAISGLTQGSSYNGSGVLATVTFKVLKSASSSQVFFNFTSGSTTDCNVTQAGTFQDILGSVTNGNYALNPPPVTMNVSLKLQGRSNFTTTGTDLKIYPTGQSTALLDKTDVATDANGNYSFTYRLGAGNYDFRLKAPRYLSTLISNQVLTNPLSLSFGTQKAGDLDNNNLVNGLDFALMNAKWFQQDANTDLNGDGLINGIDFSIMNTNWFVQGQ